MRLACALTQLARGESAVISWRMMTGYLCAGWGAGVSVTACEMMMGKGGRSLAGILLVDDQRVPVRGRWVGCAGVVGTACEKWWGRRISWRMVMGYLLWCVHADRGP